ncbi:unnamed protein product [Symbiodinium necroappetens]|uniref:Tyrosine-protein kinase ephrin type A/B receptor-like domain-containing protein n=1 Tax=Symbiodinium necroappetens TaxID=1628268 RepID=A0A813AX98_9DINO|nr:unnamed protein product [Symbiodinium necroappetens]
MPFMPRTAALAAIVLIISAPAECAKGGEFCNAFRGKCHGNLGQFMSHTLLSETGTRASEVVDFALADWDRDGDLDLVLVALARNNHSSFSSHLRFFENTAGNLSERTGCSNPFGNISINYTSDWGIGRPQVLKLVDWDGDNRTDLIIASGDLLNHLGNLRYFQQAPDGQLLELTGADSPFHMISAVEFETADWDEDGDQDLFVPCGRGYSHRTGWCYFEQLQNSSLSPRTGVANPLSGLPIDRGNRVQAVDWDGDGDLDILYSRYLSSPKLYSRAADMSLVDRGGMDFLRAGFDSVVVAADFDGDGDCDVVKMEKHWSDGQVTSFEFLEQVPDPTLKQRSGTDNPFAEIQTDGAVFPEFVDWDGDGDVDLLLGTGMGSMRFFERRADGTVEEKIGTLNPFHAVNVSGRAVPKAIDWDSDGQLELVVGARDGSLHFFKQTSNGSLYALTGQANPFQNLTVRGFAAPEVVDWDGDGDLDLFLGSSTGRDFETDGCGVFYYEQLDNATFHGRCFLTLTQKNYIVFYVAPRAGDWDRDGDVDLLLIGSTKVDSMFPPNIWYFERLASDSFSESWSEHSMSNYLEVGPFAGLPAWGARVSIADWDKDGDWDVLLGLQYFEGGWCKSPGSCQHGMCDPATGTCKCWTGYDQADCSGCGSGYFRIGKSAVYQPTEVALTRKCSPCPGILLHGTACSSRGQCHDAKHAQELALEMSPSSRAYINLTAFGEGDCECSAPFHGKSCERGECGAGFEYVKSELWSCRPCPPGYFKPGAGNGDRCEQCLKGHFAEFHGSFSCDECTHFLWRVEVTQDRAGCQYSHMNVYIGLPLVLVSMLLFLPLPFACSLRMVILDIRTLGDRVQVTTNGQHYILSRAGQVRVSFRGTKIPWLDDSSKVYYARVEDYSKLSLHNKDGSKAMLPVSETSRGEMRLLWRDAVLGVGLLNIPFICWWFVSHYWGGSFSQFVEALQKHSRGGACTQLSYWICTFSNNQWKVKEELGETWEHSSFYLALRSGLCMGTLLVLDEEAMPLTRSWCLFELLQTAVLSHENADFQGLLLCTHSGVMNYGQSNMDMAMSVSEKLSTLRLEDASASVQSDKEMIDDLVRQQPGGFTAINQYLVAAVRGALTALQRRFQNDLNRLQVNLVAADGSLRPNYAFFSGAISSADGRSSVSEASRSAASVEAISRDEIRSSSLWHRAYCLAEKVLEASKISKTSTEVQSVQSQGRFCLHQFASLA